MTAHCHICGAEMSAENHGICKNFHVQRAQQPQRESTIIHGCHRPNIHEECTRLMMCIRCEFWEEMYPDHDTAIARAATLAAYDRISKILDGEMAQMGKHDSQWRAFRTVSNIIISLRSTAGDEQG